MTRPAVAHPSWCDPQQCDVYPEKDGPLVEVFHTRLLHESWIGKERVAVEVVAYTAETAAGTVVERSADVFVYTLDGLAGRVPPGELPAVIAALQQAARLVGDTLREDEAKGSTPAWTPAGPPSSPAQAAQSAPAR